MTPSREHEEKAALLGTLLASLCQGVLMVDSNQRVRAFNPRVCELLQLDSAFLAQAPTLAEITQVQLDRGDFGHGGQLIDPAVRVPILAGGSSPIERTYQRTRRDGMVIEVQTRLLPDRGMVRTFTDITHFVRAQNELKRSSFLLEASHTLAGLGATEVNFVTNEVLWSPSMFKLMALSPETFKVGRGSTVAIIAPEYREQVKGFFDQTQDNATPYDFEVEFITGAGNRRWIHSKAELILEHGRPVRRVAVLQDTTEQKKAQLALKASEELFRDITAQIPGMVYRLWIGANGERRYTFVSDGVQELYGVTPESVMVDGSSLHPFRHPDDRAWVAAQVQHCAVNNLPLSVEFRLVLADGTAKWVQMTSSAIAVPGHGSLRNGVMIDITARKSAQIALRERDETWKLALESTGDGVWDWWVQKEQVYFSRRCLEMYGDTDGELARSALLFDHLIHPDDESSMLAARKAHFDGLAPSYSSEHRLSCRDGHWKWILSRGMVIEWDAAGKPVRMIGTHTDISRRKDAEALIWHQANFDALTGLPNRRRLREQLDSDLAECRKTGDKLALLFMDLDHFKEVNDTLGHQCGDHLLIEVAHRLRQLLNAGQTVARMGGDEFTLVLPRANDFQQLETLLKRVIATVGQSFTLADSRVFVSASVGVAIYPDDAADSENLLKHADQALYRAKDGGRNRFNYFTPALKAAALERVNIANDLRDALADKQFWLAYQPIIALQTGAFYKAEALLRWQHPGRGVMAPDTFIQVAETNGLISAIDDWATRQAIGQVKIWRDTLDSRFQMNVNKSPSEFADHNVAMLKASWEQSLAQHQLPGESLVVEITEGLLLEASDQIDTQMAAFRDAGVGVALDDFGTGYSSLHYLQKHDIDYLKIDRSFVRDLALGSKELALCNAMIVMAHALGLKVVAEGIETQEQCDLLTSAGCDFGQGYLLGRPMTAEAFATFFHQYRKINGSG